MGVAVGSQEVVHINIKYSNIVMQPRGTPPVEMNMAEAKIWGFRPAINHCQVPSEGDDRKGFNFMPCLGGKTRIA